MAKPPAPRNSEVISKSGQFNPAHVRWWEGIRDKAYSAIQSFAEINDLDAVSALDAANDFFVVYDATDGEAKKVTPGNAVSRTLTLIESVTPSVANTLVFDDIPATYQALFVEFTGLLRSAATSSTISLYVSDDNGSTYATGPFYGMACFQNGVTSTNQNRSASDFIEVSWIYQTANTSSGFVEIDDYALGSSLPKSMRAASATDGQSLGFQSSALITGVDAINAIKLQLGSGNFAASGTVSLYGRK